jgi:hypothetical protein
MSLALRSPSLSSLLIMMMPSVVVQLPLVHVALWAIGEYGDMLLTAQGVADANVDKATTFEPASEAKVLDLIGRVMRSTESKLLTKEYALNALVKLTAKFTTEDARLRKLIGSYQTSMSLELQQRSVEYSQLFSADLAKIRSGVVARMPVPAKRSREGKSEEKKAGAASPRSDDEPELPDLDVVRDGSDDEEGDEPETTSGVPAKTAAPVKSPSDPKFDSNGRGAVSPTAAVTHSVTAPVKPAAVNPLDVFGGMFDNIPVVGATTPAVVTPGIGGGAPTVPAVVAKPAVGGGGFLDDIFGGGGVAAVTTPTPTNPMSLFGASPTPGMADNGLGSMFAPQPVAVASPSVFPGFAPVAASPVAGKFIISLLAPSLGSICW